MNGPKEFSQVIGDVQRPGDYVLGVPPNLPPNIPIGPAPPHIRHVVSAYDSRPIGAYDFVLSATMNPYVSSTAPIFGPTSPDGYISVIRRIELSCVPGIVVNGTLNEWLLVIGGITIPNWRWTFEPQLNDKSIDTFIVVPPLTTMQLRSLVDPIYSASAVFVVRFIGNLILDANEPPIDMVGSNPAHVIPTKDYKLG